MDETLRDSLERSSGSALYLPESSEGPAGGGFSLGDSPYTFERRAVASTIPDAAPPRPPAERREKRVRWRRARGRPGQNAEEEAAAEIQPPAASPPIVTRRSRKRRRASEARGRRGEESGIVVRSSPPATDHRFPNVCLEPRQQPSSSSSSSLLSTSDEPSSARGDESVAFGSLSFLTEEERAWLGAETEQSAPPPSSREIGGEDASGEVRDTQVEGDALLARQLQEQFDWELRRLALPPCAGFHRRRQPDHSDALDTGPLQHHQAQSARTRQNRNGTRRSDATEEHTENSNMFDLLPELNCTWQTAVQRAALSSHLTMAQPRGRGRGGGGGFRRGQQRGGGSSAIEACFLLLGQDHDDYGALPDFEERQGTVPAAAATKMKLNKREINAFPTKTYNPAAQSAGNTRCQICFCDYAGGEELRMLTCFHDYHAKCIDRWLKVNATCPVCRCNMAERHSSRAEA